MDLVGIAFAFSAGLIAFLSPCSFPLLPAYISYYLGLKEAPAEGRATGLLKRGILGGTASAAGAILILGLIGVGVSSFGEVITPLIPKMEPIVGFILVFLGAVMLMELPVRFRVGKSVRRKGYAGLFVFGSLYALASAGCIAPIFIGVILRAVSGGFLWGMAVFMSYALGLGLLLIIVTLLVASAKEIAMARLLGAMPYVRRAGAVVLLAAGVYLLFYYFLTFP